MPDNVVLIGGFLSYTIGIVVYLAGMRINERIHFLRALNVPEPVTGGMVASLIGLAVYLFLGIELKLAAQVLSYDTQQKNLSKWSRYAER